MKTSNAIFSYNFKELCFKHQNKTIIWVKVFKNRPCKTCGRQPLKN